MVLMFDTLDRKSKSWKFFHQCPIIECISVRTLTAVYERQYNRHRTFVSQELYINQHTAVMCNTQRPETDTGVKIPTHLRSQKRSKVKVLVKSFGAESVQRINPKSLCPEGHACFWRSMSHVRFRWLYLSPASWSQCPLCVHGSLSPRPSAQSMTWSSLEAAEEATHSKQGHGHITVVTEQVQRALRRKNNPTVSAIFYETPNRVINHLLRRQDALTTRKQEQTEWTKLWDD